MTTQVSTFTKQHTHRLLDQFPSDRLSEISLFLEQLLKVVNSNVALGSFNRIDSNNEMTDGQP